MYPATSVPSGGFSPLELGVPRLYADAASGVALEAGAVASWVALEGERLEQSNGLYRPALIESDSAFGGAPSVQFSGAQFMQTASAVGGGSSSWTLWAVLRFDSHASVRTAIDTAAPSSAPFAILGLNAADAIRYGVYGYATGPTLDTAAHLVAVTVRNAAAPNFELWVDGTRAALVAGTFGDPFATSALAIGRDHTPFGWYFRGAIAALGLSGLAFEAADHAALLEWAQANKGVA